ncbi:MAG: TetR family transcriptional regulator [Actinomycetota bacterium]
MALSEKHAPGLRTRKKEQVRSTLHSEALNLFASKGFATTTIDDIVAAADVSRSTFFRYFPSKEAVVFAGYDEAGERLRGLLEARPEEEGPIDAFEAAYHAGADQEDLEPHRRVAKARERLLENEERLRSRHMEFVKKWERAIADAFAQRAGRKEAGEADRLAASVCITAANRVSEQWWASGGTLEPHELIRAEFALLRDLLKGGNG